jgi:hypothetical protein
LPAWLEKELSRHSDSYNGSFKVVPAFGISGKKTDALSLIEKLFFHGRPPVIEGKGLLERVEIDLKHLVWAWGGSRVWP